MDPPIAPGTARWAVLATLTQQQTMWTAPQVAVHTELPLETVIRCLGWLREHKLLEIVTWAKMDTLHVITATGQEQLRVGAQLQLDGVS